MIHFASLPPNTEGFTGTTRFFDYESPTVRAFIEETIAGASDQRERAVRLFYAVRDQIRYDPYRITFDEQAYHASSVIQAGYGWCISKAKS